MEGFLHKGKDISLRKIVLKVTNERQDGGAGILHQVAQFPIDLVYFYICKAPMSLSTHASVIPNEVQPTR